MDSDIVHRTTMPDKWDDPTIIISPPDQIRQLYSVAWKLGVKLVPNHHIQWISVGYTAIMAYHKIIWLNIEYQDQIVDQSSHTSWVPF